MALSLINQWPPPPIWPAAGDCAMIAVIFVARPHTDQLQRYFDLVAELRPLLAELGASFPSSASRASASLERCCHCHSGATKRPYSAGADWNSIVRLSLKGAPRSSKTIACASPMCRVTTPSLSVLRPRLIAEKHTRDGRDCVICITAIKKAAQ